MNFEEREGKPSLRGESKTFTEYVEELEERARFENPAFAAAVDELQRLPAIEARKSKYF